MPKDQLLVWNVKDGWGPLCDFLGLSIPDKPFPHKNKRANLLDELRKENPVMIRMEREFKFSLGVLTTMFAFGFYKIAQRVPWRSVCKWARFTK